MISIKTKSLLAALLIICILTAVFPVNPVFAVKADDVVQFEDAFIYGNLFWKFSSNHMKVDGGCLKSSSLMGYDISLSDESIMWRDYTFECDVIPIAPRGDRVSLAAVEFGIRGYKISLRLDKKTVTYESNLRSYSTVSTSGTVGEFFEEFRANVKYSVRLAAKDEYISVFIKKDGGYWYDVGSFMDSTKDNGSPFLRPLLMEAKFDNVKVYSPAGSTGILTERVLKLPVGEEKELNYIKSGNENIKWVSSDNEIASIDDNGKLKALKNGTLTVYVMNEAGDVLDNALVRCYVPLQGIKFPITQKTMYVGDTMDAKLDYTNTSATIITTSWSSSDSSVVELVGDVSCVFNRAPVRALSEGTAVLTAVSYDGEFETSMEITVKERPKTNTEDAVFMYNGKSRIIPQDYGLFGEAPQKMQNEMGRALWSDEEIKAYQDIGFNSVRGPDGPKGNRYIWKRGYPYGNGWPNHVPDFDGWWMDDIFHISNTLDIPYVYNIALAYPADDKGNIIDVESWEFTTGNYGGKYRAMRSAEDIVEEVKAVDAACDEKFAIELGNELYAIGMEPEIPRVEDYLECIKRVAAAIHEYDPDIPVITCALDRAMERRIIGDPNNWTLQEDNPAYTQGARVWDWNPKVASVSDYYDGIVSHEYSTIQDVSNQTPDEFRRTMYTDQTDKYYGFTSLWHQFKVPAYITEWGQYFGVTTFSASDKDRLHDSITHNAFSSALLMELYFNMVKSDHIVHAAYCDLIHPTFGMMITNPGEETKYSPRYFAFKKIGELMANNTHYYDIDLVNGDYSVELLPFITPSSSYNVDVPQAVAYGLGDADGLKEVVISNHTASNLNVALSGVELRKTWAVKQDIEWDNFMVATDAHFYAEPDESLCDDFVTYKDEAFADTVTLSPYELVILEVNGTPTVNKNSSATVIDQTNQYLFSNAVVLKTDNNVAWVDNQKKHIDENDSVKADVINGRTVIPLRFVSESLGAQVDYDDVSQKISITNAEHEVIFTLGDVNYTVDGEQKLLDVAPYSVAGRTLVPLRALSEALGKYVFWDDSGLIVISNFEFMFAIGTYRDEVYDNLIEDAMKLFE